MDLQTKEEKSIPLPPVSNSLKFKIVGILSLLFGIPLTLFVIGFLLRMILSISNLAKQDYYSTLFIFILSLFPLTIGLANIFFGIKNLKTSDIKKFKLRIILLITAVLLLAYLSSATIMFLIIDFPKYFPSIFKNSSNSALISNSTPKSDSASNLKTYINRQEGYSIKYLENFDIELQTAVNTLLFVRDLNNRQHAVLIQVKGKKDQNQSLKDFINTTYFSAKFKDLKFTERTLNSHPALFLEIKQGLSKIYFQDYLFVERDDLDVIVVSSFPIYSEKNDPNKILFDQILSTFKFVDKSETFDLPSSNWKEYAYPSLGYSFRAPSYYLVSENKQNQTDRRILQNLNFTETESEGPNDFTITVYSLKDGDIVFHGEVNGRRSITIDKNVWNVIDFGSKYKATETQLSIKVGDKLYVVKGKNQNIYTNIINTFKFTE